MSGKSKASAASAVAKCPVPGCKIKLEGANVANCATCGIKVCRNHVYPSDHTCLTKKSAPSSSLEVVPKKVVETATAASIVKKGGLEVVPKQQVESKPLPQVEEKMTLSPKPSSAKKSLQEVLDSLSSVTTQMLLEEIVDVTKHSKLSNDHIQSKMIQALEFVLSSSSPSNSPESLKVMNFARLTMAEAATLPNDSRSIVYERLESYLKENLKPLDRDVQYVAKRWASIVTLYGFLAARSLSVDGSNLISVVDSLSTWACIYPGLAGRNAAANASAEVLLWRARDTPAPFEEPQSKQLVLKLWNKCTSAAESDTCNPFKENDPLTAPAKALACVIRGLGIACLDAYELFPQVVQSISKLGRTSIAGLYLVHLLCMELKRLFEPHTISAKLIQSCMTAYAKGSPIVRQGAESAGISLLTHTFGPRGISMVLPVLETALNDASWRIKEFSLKLLSALTLKAPTDSTVSDNLFLFLPSTLPLVMVCIHDTKKEVEMAASALLDSLVQVVTNPETQKLMPYLLKAIKMPSHVDKFLEELMDLTIVNSLDSQSLALIMPVVIRGLREGGTDQKKKAAIATGNVCTLVKDVSHIAVYYPAVHPELVKLQDHSSPQVREAAKKANDSLSMALTSHANDTLENIVEKTLHSSAAIATPFDRNLITSQTMSLFTSGNEQMGDLSLDPSSSSSSPSSSSSIKGKQRAGILNDISISYVTDTMVWLLGHLLRENNVTNLTLDRIERDVENAVGPLFVETYGKAGGSTFQSPRSAALVVTSFGSPKMKGSQQQQQQHPNLVKRLAQLLFSHIRRIRSKSFEEQEAAQDTILIDLPDIILAFASRVLLHRTSLRMHKGHRYALIGQNGVGKTTFLRRLATRDIGGFPSSVLTFHVEHEILSEDKDLTVLKFMLHGDGTNIPSEEACMKALAEVGFSEDVMRNTAVGSLSGGWRMRLAIARSMTVTAHLLLFDEPTNHLDHASNLWLSDYICGLKATVCVVSHDYDFLGRISTDIIHIKDQKLEYFEGTFGEFQLAHPDIVAALPKPAKSIEYGAATSSSSKEEIPDAVELMEKMLISSSDSSAFSSGGNQTPPLPPPTPELSEGERASAFELLSGPEAEEAMRKRNILPMKFPDPGKLEGITSRGKPVLKLTDIVYGYPTDSGTRRVILNGVNCFLSMNSRVCLVGKNGAGKSTLLKLLIGELEVNEMNGDMGKVWKHQNLRTSYISQHSMHHLESEIESTPVQYIQRRFYEGRDKEAAKMITLSMTPEEEAVANSKGEICGILSRVVRGKTLCYEIDVTGRSKKEGRSTGRPGEGGRIADYRSLDELEKMGKPHILKLVRMFDEKLKAEASGMDIRPITIQECMNHLNDFGINNDLANRKIRWMSGGQRSRLVVAAAMWSKPHLIAADEPSNFLDNDGLAVLTHALKYFKGGVVTVSHHQAFVEALCNELWHVADGKVTVEKTKKGEEVAAVKAGV